MTWFEKLTGFHETTPHDVRRNLTVSGDKLTSHVNGRVMTHGRLEMPSLAELRARVPLAERCGGTLSVREVVSDATALHSNPLHAGALLQVASQFNLLEMMSPRVTPERGVGIYENDPTQGPACAIAAGAGTIYRNYFVPVNGQVGQSATKQLDCLEDLGLELGNSGSRLWTMQNGYALASGAGLREISSRLSSAGDEELDALRGSLRIGVQWDTEVTVSGSGHRVTQAYCSALPVAYSEQDVTLWEDFARLVLEAAYEATLLAAILNARATGNRRPFLTLLGGGAFGNEPEWIIGAMKRALTLHKESDLDVAIVSFRSSRRDVRAIVEQLG